MKSTVYWLNIGLGLGCAGVLAAMAYPLASLFRQDQVFPVILALAVVFPLSSIGLLHQALLERDSQFRRMAAIETVSAFGGLCLAILLAAGGAGIWSLVGQMIFAAALGSAQLLLSSRWRPALVFRKADMRVVLGFGTHLSLFRLLNYFEQNADSMIIGRMLGPTSLGVYSMAYKVMLFPLQNLTAVSSRALFPALSRNQESAATIGRLYLRSVGMVSVIAAPLMAGAFMLRHEFVTIVFGPRWSEVATIFQWLAPVGFIQSISAGTGIVFMALGRSRMLLALGLLGAVLQVSAFFIGVRWGLEGVAASFFVANVLNLFPCFCCAIAVLKLAPWDAVVEVGKPLLASGFMVFVLYLVGPVVLARGWPVLGYFLCQVLCGALAYVFALLVLLQQDISDFRAIARFG